MKITWIKGIGVVLAVVMAVSAAGCRPKKKPQAAIDFGQQLPPGQVALRKISPDQYPDFAPAFANANLVGVEKAIGHSIDYLSRGSTRGYFPYLDIDHPRAVATLHKLREIVKRELSGTRTTPSAINAEIAANFEVYKSVGAPDPSGGFTERVLFTGYYTPILEASLTRQGPYQYPIYKRPADLVTDPISGEVFGRKMPDGSTQPYPKRGEIEQTGMLNGQELAWLKDRFDAYIVHIQGSGKLRLPDGRMMEVGYAGNNGYTPVSVALELVKDGHIPRAELNLTSVRTYFRNNPQAMDRYLPMNPRFVFFTESKGGPYGSLNVPVTPFASIATDKAVYPRAMPAFLMVPVPMGGGGGAMTDFRGFMLDQDTGGAIRAPGRTDIYMGVGDQAERMAGYQLHEGELYYLAIKPELVQPPAARR
jgi:membrane-bound lytic murein transglycosylase A